MLFFGAGRPKSWARGGVARGDRPVQFEQDPGLVASISTWVLDGWAGLSASTLFNFDLSAADVELSTAIFA